MQALRVEINTLVVPVDRQLERQTIYKSLKACFERAVKIANEAPDIKVRLQALRLVGYLAQILAGFIRDFALEEIENEIAKLEEQT